MSAKHTLPLSLPHAIHTPASRHEASHAYGEVAGATPNWRGLAGLGGGRRHAEGTPSELGRGGFEAWQGAAAPHHRMLYKWVVPAPPNWGRACAWSGMVASSVRLSKSSAAPVEPQARAHLPERRGQAASRALLASFWTCSDHPICEFATLLHHQATHTSAPLPPLLPHRTVSSVPHAVPIAEPCVQGGNQAYYLRRTLGPEESVAYRRTTRNIPLAEPVDR